MNELGPRQVEAVHVLYCDGVHTDLLYSWAMQEVAR